VTVSISHISALIKNKNSFRSADFQKAAGGLLFHLSEQAHFRQHFHYFLDGSAFDDDRCWA